MTALRFIALWWLAACCPARPVPPPPAPVPAVAPAPVAQSDGFAERAAHFVALAKSHEPTVTPMLLALAAELGGEMYKLEFRLKTQESAERKIRLLAAEHHLTAEQVYLDDALRYTMLIDDVPPRHYVDTCKAALTRLDAGGHHLVRAKNYWPTDDSYSGINSVLRTRDGLEWELQFHTHASVEAQNRTRPLYEEMRATTTAPDRKRALFDEMTTIWNQVPIPEGVLVPGALGEIIQRERP